MDLIVILCPLISAFLFIFSIASMSSHKIWCLFPLCFYPFFRIITTLENKINSNTPYISIQLLQKMTHSIKISKAIQIFKNHKVKFISIFLISSLLYSCVGASYMETNFKHIFENSEMYCKNKSNTEINDILVNESHARSEEEYTYALMCQYWNNNLQ
jgi:hypothetical protein